MTWTGSVSTDALNPNNWSPARRPLMDDHVVFSGSVDCVGFVGSPWESMENPSDGSYAAITVAAGYTGTVVLDATIVVDTLEIYGGTIDQPE